MWDGKSSPLAIIKAKINVILESLCVLEIGQDANQDGDYDFAWLDLLELSKQFYVRISRVSKFRVVQSEWQTCLNIESYIRIACRHLVYCKVPTQYQNTYHIFFCFDLCTFIWQKFWTKNSARCLLKTDWQMKIYIFRGTHIFLSNYNVLFCYQPLCF